MPASESRNDDALRDSIARLCRVDESKPLDAARYFNAVAQELSNLFGRTHVAMAYRPAPVARDWIVAAAGQSARRFTADFPSVASAPGFLLFDPLRPKPPDRNIVQIHERPEYTHASDRVFERLGSQVGQTRILLCDGPVLLGWLGVVRSAEHAAAIPPRALRAFAIGIRRRLRLALGIPAGLSRSTFEASVDAYPGEAYVVRADGSIEYANALGAARLDGTARDLKRELADVVASRSPSASTFQLHPLGRSVSASFFLATGPSAAPADLETRLADARRRWRLTPRRLDVLRRLALGDANKDIATRLGISLRTVEAYVAAMLVAARVDSRLQLVVRVWKGD